VEFGVDITKALFGCPVSIYGRGPSTACGRSCWGVGAAVKPFFLGQLPTRSSVSLNLGPLGAMSYKSRAGAAQVQKEWPIIAAKDCGAVEVCRWAVC
jgi:hypothetical protein